jgi:hypothetical protein
MAVRARITVGRIQILDVDASPNGTVTAPRGSIAVDDTVPQTWQNVDGAMTWVFLNAAVDPREIFRYSMFHNVGVTGGG